MYCLILKFYFFSFYEINSQYLKLGNTILTKNVQLLITYIIFSIFLKFYKKKEYFLKFIIK
ncbi:MAG TPA: hypothetical protein DDZ41_03100 [Flavobacterium sp.]|nr:hypothetical protein [Flavobacterium sp.]